MLLRLRSTKFYLKWTKWDEFLRTIVVFQIKSFTLDSNMQKLNTSKYRKCCNHTYYSLVSTIEDKEGKNEEAREEKRVPPAQTTVAQLL